MSRIRYGIHVPLEKAADDLIFGSLKGVTSQTEKSDILTPWKDADRHRKEVLAHSGVVDAQVRKGMYHRAANTAKPYLNSRDGVYPAKRIPTTAQSSDESSHAVEWTNSAGAE